MSEGFSGGSSKSDLEKKAKVKSDNNNEVHGFIQHE